MSTLPLYIVMHGLVALVPMNDTDGANRMSALLVDARDPLPGAEAPGCFKPHIPMLVFTPRDSTSCVPAGCSLDVDQCLCTAISRQNIVLSIDPSPALAKQRLNQRPLQSLPFSGAEADDFAYIANLTRLAPSWDLDRRFLDPVPPTNLAARMDFPFETLLACALGLRQDEGSRNVHPMSFRPYGKLEGPENANQALAQMAVAKVEISDQATVTLTIGAFGETGRDLILMPKTAPSGELSYMVELHNMRVPDTLPFDDPCDDGVGRDFAYFYELMKNKPAWKDRPLPHVKHTLWKSVRDLETEGCKPLTKVPSSRPVCPMASFN